MEQIRLNGLHLWQFASLANQAAIQHFVTDRDSLADGREFSLSLSSSEDVNAIRSNRSDLANAMQVPVSALHFPSQVHGIRIAKVTGKTIPVDVLETDALITNEVGQCIAVMSADCVPILLFDRRNLAVGAVHSGWRGTVARILEKTLQEMHKQFGTRAEDLLASIGPSVSQPSYEVGAEVVQEVNKAFGPHAGLLHPVSEGKARLDLWKANIIQLKEFGVSTEQIEVAGLCTVLNNDHFFSARKGDRGRFAAGILLKDPSLRG